MNEELETKLSILIERLNHIEDDDKYGSKRTFLTYRIEILKRDIQIAKLMQPAIQKAMLAPLPPIYIKQALTPPTADEVSKALSEYLKCEVRYDDETFIANRIEHIIVYKSNMLKGLKFEYVLPPHLITMIGQFYEAQND